MPDNARKMTTKERRALVTQYVNGYKEVIAALAEMPPDKLTAHPLRGKWSACEIVHHLADSETRSALRLRQLLAEHNPIIHGYDQDTYADRLFYNERDMQPALDAFCAARATSAQLIARMSETDWQRAGWHTESGVYTCETWLRVYAAHGHGHAEQIRALTAALQNGRKNLRG